ncbi:tyrosine--tRNA ligase [Robiginitomaculum antarcticum]|uniref:tyrosine--tRNA ligase n=1 Tax=Robiginitomaculum antarcticum TaxID=437507 RepID=UPI000369D959|nr:tyrosine--tRNA ligase [Robiginitomaculum antarcticum]
MSAYKSDLMSVLTQRGYLYQCTDEQALDKAAHDGTLTGYIGFDCTAPSLHVGSMVQIMMLRRLQQAGHRPIVLLGGGTTKVGDPTDKDKSRPILTDEQIEINKAGIRQVFAKLIDFDGPNGAVMVDNADWLDKLGYVELLREYGTHFTVNRMVQLDTVKRRLETEQPMTFLEFNYSIMQSYDFCELNRRYGCTLQMGGSDQWGNIVSGADLTRRKTGNICYGFTTPLITTASGGKMGKTADGAVWLNNEANIDPQFTRSPYEYWQFWRNTEDADVGRFLRLFTDVPLDEIAVLEALDGAAINEAKVRLANEATTMLHGSDAAREAEQTAKTTFEQGGTADGLPTFEIAAAEIETMGVLNAATLVGLAGSNGEARRHIKAGALKINDEKVGSHEDTLSGKLIDGVVKISVGKKKHALIKAV